MRELTRLNKLDIHIDWSEVTGSSLGSVNGLVPRVQAQDLSEVERYLTTFNPEAFVDCILKSAQQSLRSISIVVKGYRDGSQRGCIREGGAPAPGPNNHTENGEDASKIGSR